MPMTLTDADCSWSTPSRRPGSPARAASAEPPSVSNSRTPGPPPGPYPPLQHRQVLPQLESRDLAAVLLPLLLLVPEEEVEDVFAEGFGDQVAAFHQGEG